MTRRSASTLVIRDPAVLRALRTPLRQEVLAAVQQMRTASVKDVAAELGRKPASLYYHVHELARVGLIREAGARPAGRRVEALYEPAADRIVIDRSIRTPAFVDALADLERATLRTAERELRAALAGSPHGRSVAGRALDAAPAVRATQQSGCPGGSAEASRAGRVHREEGRPGGR